MNNLCDNTRLAASLHALGRFRILKTVSASEKVSERFRAELQALLLRIVTDWKRRKLIAKMKEKAAQSKTMGLLNTMHRAYPGQPQINPHPEMAGWSMKR